MTSPQQPRGPRRSKFLVRNASGADLQAALASESDIVCVDLEDTVEDKAAARALAASLKGVQCRAELSLRLNALSTEEGLRDLLMLKEWSWRPPIVVLTKVEDPYEVALAGSLLKGVELYAIIETARGLQLAESIGKASSAVSALLLGGKDLSHALGCARNWEGLAYARGRLIHAAALAGVEAHDEPYRPLEDLEGLAETCRKARAMGYAGKATVDLRHVPVINALFSKTA